MIFNQFDKKSNKQYINNNNNEDQIVKIVRN